MASAQQAMSAMVHLQFVPVQRVDSQLSVHRAAICAKQDALQFRDQAHVQFVRRANMLQRGGSGRNPGK